MPSVEAARKAIRHGLVTQTVLHRMSGWGLHVDLYYLFRFRIGDRTDPIPARGTMVSEELTLHVLGSADIPEMVADSWATESQLQERVQRGHVCLGLRSRGELAAYLWADLDEVNDEACDFQLGPGEAYIYDVYGAPAFRGRGLSVGLRYEFYRHLEEAGYHTFYSVVDRFNTPAIRLSRKIGTEPIRSYLRLQIGQRVMGPWMREVGG